MNRAAAVVVLTVTSLLALPTASTAQDSEVWLVGSTIRPSVVRYLRAQLAELGVTIRTTRNARDARGALIVEVARRSARIATREGSDLVDVRTVSLPHGLDTAGRARLAHALRTVIRARTPK